MKGSIIGIVSDHDDEHEVSPLTLLSSSLGHGYRVGVGTVWKTGGKKTLMLTLRTHSGSVRMPSAFNALFTIRPSTLRVPYGKATNSMLGQESIRSVCGPMCRSVASVDYFMRVVLDACPADYDATAFPFPYNNKLHDKVASYKKLAFGYAKTDGHVHPVTPAIRAMDETIAALKAAGHEGMPCATSGLTPFDS